MRIQKLLSQQGVCSRREAENWIKKKRIRIDGQIATLGDRYTDGQVISIDNEPLDITPRNKIKVLAFHKPRNVETTFATDPEQRTFADFDFGNERVFNVGRLDKDSQGLIFLTNNGEFANKIAHPSHQKTKKYLVSINNPVTETMLKNLMGGIILNGKKTAPCKARKIEENVFEITLTEGRNRQIRKMVETQNAKVLELIRVKIGPIWLGELKMGKWRVLSETEINSL